MKKPNPPRNKSGYWRISYRDDEGKSRSKSFGAVASVSERDAIREFHEWWAEYVQRPDKSRLIRKGKIDVAIKKYKEHIADYYTRIDPATGERVPTTGGGNLKVALNHLTKSLGTDRVLDDLEPDDWRKVQSGMIDRDMSRNAVNENMRRLRTFVKWCVSQSIASPESLAIIQSIQPLKYGRTKARESKGVEAVSLDIVEATCKHLPQTLADMIWTQYWGGMRPGEVCSMTWAEIDRTSEPWIFRPAHHKNAHHGKSRRIFLGPNARRILEKYHSLTLKNPIFSPKRAIEERAAMAPTHRRENQKPNQVKTDRVVGDAYVTATYARAINRACVAAGVPNWSPNQLRHAAEQRIEMIARQSGEHGIGAAKAVLGHSQIETTHSYRDSIDIEIARKWAEKSG